MNKEWEKKTNMFAKILLEIVDLWSFFIMALGIVFFIRLFIFSPFTVVWQSMEPTLHEWDFLIVDKISSLKDKVSASDKVQNLLPEIERGDIIVFIPPQESDGKHLVKRVIWVPWDIVKIQDGKVSICSSGIECQLLDEPYLKEWETTSPDRGLDTFDVLDGYFVMWDNRNHSTDSRSCFMWVWCYEWYSYIVPYQSVIWKVWMRLSPDYTRY